MMQILTHCWQLLLFLLILFGPSSICLSLVLADNQYKQRKISHNIMAFLIYWCTIEICIGLFLGIIGQFFLTSVLLIEIILFAIGFINIFLRQYQSLIQFWKILTTLKPSLNSSELMTLGALSFSGCVLLERLATLPIIDYDSLWYHLPIMARWYQEGAFIPMPDFMNTGLWTTDQIIYYPFNWEILCTLFIMPFQEDFLVALPNFFTWLILGISIYLISDFFGARRDYNLAAASLVLTIPLLLQHVNSLHIDLPFAAFFMTSAYFSVLFHRTRSPFDITLFLISLGMLFGIKMSAVGYAVIPVIILCLLEIYTFFIQKQKHSFFDRDLKTVFPIILMGGFCLLFVGGFWYFKNLFSVGNPLGDVQVQIGGLSFPGSVRLSDLRQTSLANLFQFTNSSHLKVILMQFIVRLQLPLLALLAQFFVFPYVFFARSRRVQWSCLAGCLLLLGATVYLYWTTPMTGTNLLPPGPINPYIGQQVRFAFPAMAFLGVAAALVATAIQPKPVITTTVVLLSSILGIVSTSIFDIIRTETAFKGVAGWASKILDGFRTNPVGATDQVIKLMGTSLGEIFIYIALYIVMIGLMFWIVFGELRISQFFLKISNLFCRFNKLILSFLICISLSATAIARERRNLETREVYRGIYDFIAQSVKPNETIGYLFSERSYFLYGKSLNQKVVYIPSKANSLPDWIYDLKQQKVKLIAIGPLEAKMGWRESNEIQWLTSKNRNFTKVFGKNPEKEVVIYRLNSY